MNPGAATSSILSLLLLGFAPAKIFSVSFPDPGNRWQCSNDGTIIDISEFEIVRKDVVPIPSSSGIMWSTLDGQYLLVKRKTGMERSFIPPIVARGPWPDIFIKHATLQGRPVLYWRETYLHRQYRQGILKYVGPAIFELCEGIGGSPWVH